MLYLSWIPGRILLLLKRMPKCLFWDNAGFRSHCNSGSSLETLLLVRNITLDLFSCTITCLTLSSSPFFTPSKEDWYSAAIAFSTQRYATATALLAISTCPRALNDIECSILIVVSTKFIERSAQPEWRQWRVLVGKFTLSNTCDTLDSRHRDP